MSDLLSWELPLPVNIRISCQKSTYNTLKAITIRHYPVKNTNRYGIRYPEHIFLLPVKSLDQFLCLVVLLASPSSSGILHPIPTKNKAYFPTFLYQSHYEHYLQSWSVSVSHHLISLSWRFMTNMRTLLFELIWTLSPTWWSWSSCWLRMKKKRSSVHFCSS